MRKPMLVLIGLFCMLLTAAPVTAQDIEGSGDHPLLERIAGSHIRSFDRDEFTSVTLPTGPWDQSAREYVSSTTVEGEWIRMVYGFDDEDISALRVHRSFLDRLPQSGFELIFEGGDMALIEGTRGRAANFMLADGGGRRLLIANLVLNQREAAYYLIARHQTEPVTIAISTVIAAGRPGGTHYVVNIVTEEEMVIAMDHRPLSAGEMEAGLISEGRVAIQDILFGFDSDVILPESSESLATIADLLRDRPELKLLVVGHTDDVGDFDYNLRLSMSRAQAVARYLSEQHGIAAERLSAAGAGMMAPLASNRSEAGRAQNRRVELVEIR